MAARSRTIGLAGVSFFLLFASFRQNLWRAAEGTFFALNQQDCEALVLGRMVFSHQNAFLGGGGLLGLAGTGAGLVTFDTVELWQLKIFDLQTEAYLTGTPVRSFSPYFSHSGLQGLAFASLDRLLGFVSPAGKLSLFRSLTAALVAAAYTLLILWLRREFGLGAALFSLLIMLASPWLTAFGRNLYWSLWLFLLPVLAIGAVLAASPGRGDPSRRLAVAAFLTLLVRFLSGFEYVTETAAMALAPLLYYAIRDAWPLRLLSRRLALLAGAGLAALVVSLGALTLQIVAVTGSGHDAARHIRFALARRARGDPSAFPPIYGDALRAKTLDVVRPYLAQRFRPLDGAEGPPPFRWLSSRTYGQLVVCTLAAAAWVAVRAARMPAQRRRRPLALAAATLCALLGVLAWLVIFKAHSYLHLHVNPVMWHLLFLPLGAALVFCAAEDAALLAFHRRRPGVS